MDIGTVSATVAQLVGTVGALVWLARRNARLLDKVAADLGEVKTDTAVIKAHLAHQDGIRKELKSDHDSLIRLQEQQKINKKDIDGAFKAIRNIEEKVNGTGEPAPGH